VTLRDWLGAREPTQPPALARRIVDLAAPYEQASGDIAERCLTAAEQALSALLASDMTSRHGALDLLAIDALVTYAFEFASNEPARIPALASATMARLSGLTRPP